MKELSQRDLLAILDFLRGAAAVGGPRTFAMYVTTELPRVIPSAMTAFAELDLVKRSVYWVMDPLDPSMPNPAEILAAHIPDNPFILYLYRKHAGDAGAIRLSDLTTARAFRDTGIYREFYRPLHLNYSMACALRLSRQELAAIALYRSGSDFSERDRLCLNLLLPHLADLQRQSEAMARVRRDLTLVTRGVEASGHAFVIVGPGGRIRRAGQRTQRWLPVAAGATNPAIAARLRISPRTVQTHLDRVYRKLGVQTRSAAAARALDVLREAHTDQA